MTRYFYHLQRSWGKVIFSQTSVILLGGGCASSRCLLREGGGCLLWGVSALGVSALGVSVLGVVCLLWGGFCSREVSAPGGSGPGGVWSRGVSALRGVVCSHGGSGPRGVCSPEGSALRRGCAWWRLPRDGHCCGRYASYWNAFLLLTANIVLFEMLRTTEADTAVTNSIRVNASFSFQARCT